jgi:hypothetical protein
MLLEMVTLYQEQKSREDLLMVVEHPQEVTRIILSEILREVSHAASLGAGRLTAY